MIEHFLGWLINRLNAIYVGYKSYRLWLESDDDGLTRLTVAPFGVPKVVLFLGKGREAWRVSHLSIEAWGLPEPIEKKKC